MGNLAGNGLKLGQEVFCPTNLDLADILRSMDFDFENFHFSDFWDSTFADSQVPKFWISRFLDFQISRFPHGRPGWLADGGDCGWWKDFVVECGDRVVAVQPLL